VPSITDPTQLISSATFSLLAPSELDFDSGYGWYSKRVDVGGTYERIPIMGATCSSALGSIQFLVSEFNGNL
jgi:hypothetical protein